MNFSSFFVYFGYGLKLNAKLVVDLLKKDEGNPNGFDAIVTDCKDGLKEIPLVQIHHCYREVNKCADALVKKDALLLQDFVVFLNSSKCYSSAWSRRC